MLMGSPSPLLTAAWPALDLNFARDKVLPGFASFSRSSGATYFDANGVLQTASSGAARFDHSGGTSLGLLIEEARTNVVLWNRDLTNAAWTASNVTVAKTATTTASVTRAADVCSILTSAFPFNASEGTIVCVADTSVPTSVIGTLCGLDAGASTERIFLRFNLTGAGSFNVTNSGSGQANIVLGSWAPNVASKFAGAWAANDFSAAQDGALGTPDTSGSIPTVATLKLGIVAGSNALNGHIRSLAYFPRRLPDTQLQAMTA